MKKLKLALKIMTGTSGASLMFVLAAMLLLMAIGTSVMVASGANVSADLAKRLNNQLNIYADSMHLSVMHSLNAGSADVDRYVTGAPDPSFEPVTLGGQIIREIYSPAAIETDAGDYSVTISDTFDSYADDGAGTVDDLTAIFTNVSIDMEATVNLTPYVALVPELIEEIIDDTGIPQPVVIAPEVPEVLRSAMLNGTVTVTVTAEHGGRSVISVVTYGFTDVLLEEDFGGSGNMLIKNAGNWGFVSREQVDK